MAYYYTLHLTYREFVSTLLSVIQTEVLHDAIHDQDATTAYKKAMNEWKSFVKKYLKPCLNVCCNIQKRQNIGYLLRKYLFPL